LVEHRLITTEPASRRLLNPVPGSGGSGPGVFGQLVQDAVDRRLVRMLPGAKRIAPFSQPDGSWHGRIGSGRSEEDIRSEKPGSLSEGVSAASDMATAAIEAWSLLVDALLTESRICLGAQCSTVLPIPASLTEGRQSVEAH